MGTDLVIYAEVYDGAGWKAKPIALEKISYGSYEAGSCWEPRSVYFERNRGLYRLLAGEQGIDIKLATREQLDRYRSGSGTTFRRSFPDDVSNELLDDYCRRYCNCYGEEVIPETIRQQAKQNREVSWLSLEELNQFDWSSSQGRCYGEVKLKDAALFGDGEQTWTALMANKAWCWIYYPLRGQAPPTNPYICQAGYTQVSWIEIYSQSFAETAGDIFMQQTLPLLRTYGSPQEVRIIFWLNA